MIDQRDTARYQDPGATLTLEFTPRLRVTHIMWTRLGINARRAAVVGQIETSRRRSVAQGPAGRTLEGVADDDGDLEREVDRLANLGDRDEHGRHSRFP